MNTNKLFAYHKLKLLDLHQLSYHKLALNRKNYRKKPHCVVVQSPFSYGFLPRGGPPVATGAPHLGGCRGFHLLCRPRLAAGAAQGGGEAKQRGGHLFQGLGLGMA